MAKPLGTKPRNTSFNGGSQHGFEIPMKHLNQNEDGHKEILLSNCLGNMEDGHKGILL